MSDRKIKWSILADFNNLRKEAKRADRALEDLEDRHGTLGDAALDSGKKQGQGAAIVEQATKRHTAAVDKNEASLTRWGKVQQRVLDSRKREVEQTEAVMAAKAGEEKALAKLYKAQNKHVDVVKRAEEVNNRAKATEFQRVRAFDQVRAAIAQVDAAQLRYNETQRRTTVVVDDTTRSVNRSRTALGRYKKDSESAWKTLAKGGKALSGPIKMLAMLGVKAAIGIPLIFGLVSAVGQLAGGAVAMVSALAPAVGLLGSIPGMAMGAAAAMGTLVLGFGGLGGALKAASKAEEALTEEQQKARAEMSASERAAADYADALAKLPKETQSFAKYLVSLKPKLNQLKAAAAKGLMPGAEAGLKSVMKLFPTVAKSVASMGKSFGDSFKALGAAMASKDYKTKFENVMGSNNKIAKVFATGMKDAALILLSVADAARPLTEWLVKLAGGWLKNRREVLETAKGMQKLRDFLDKTKLTLQTWGNIFKNIGVGLKNIGVIGYDSGQKLTESFENATKKFKEWTEKDYNQTKLKKFFDDSKETVEGLGRIVNSLGGILGGLVMPDEGDAPGSGFVKALEGMMPTLESIIKTLSENMGTGIIDAIKSLLEAFDSFLQNGGAEALGTFSDVVATLADGVKKFVEIPGAAETVAGIAVAFGAFKALKFMSAITGITSLGGAIRGFYRDAKRPSGYVDPAFGPGGMGGGTGGGTGSGGTPTGAFFPGGGGSGNPTTPKKKPHWYSRKPDPGMVYLTPTGSPTAPAAKKPHWYSRKPDPSTVALTPTGFAGSTTPGGVLSKKKKPPGRSPGKWGSRAGGAANKIGAAAGAVWLGSQFIDPESTIGKKAGDFSSLLSAAMFAPMLGGLIPKKGGAVRTGARKVGGAFKKGGVARTGAAKVGTKVGGAAKGAAGLISKGTTGAMKAASSAGKSLSTIFSILSMNLGTFVKMAGTKFLSVMKSLGGTLKMLGGAFASIGRMLGRGLLTAFSKLGGFLTRLGTTLLKFASKILPMVSKAFLLLGRAMMANPFALIVLAIVALVAAFVLLYKKNETFREFIDKVWAAIKVAIKSVVDWFVNTAWPWLKQAFDNIGKVVGWLWNNIIKPYFTLMWAFWKTVFSWLLNTGWPLLRSAFNFIGTIVTWLWNNIIKPYFTLIWNIVKTVFQWILNTGWPLLKSAFDKIAAGAKWLWDKGIKPAFDFIKGGVEALVKVFQTVKDQIGKVWSGLVSKIAGPISTVIDWINRNFIGKINQLLGKIGVSFRLPSIPGGASVPKDNASSGGGRSTAGGQWATGGYIPGQSPTSTSDNIPAWLTAGEFVTRQKSTKRMQRKHPGALEYINRTGELPRYSQGGAFGASPLMARWYKRVAQAKGHKFDTGPRFAYGGPVDAFNRTVSKGVSTVKGGVSDAWDFFTDVPGFIKGKLSDLLSKLGLSGMVKALAEGVGGKSFPEIAKVAKDKMTAFFGEGGGGSGTVGSRTGHTLSRVRALIAASHLPLSITSTYRSPARNAAVGGVKNSLHMNASNPAVDVGGPHWALDALYVAARVVDKWRQLIWQAPGHYDHIHFASMGGLVPGFARGGKVPGSGSKDTVPAMLTPGEFVLNKGASSSLGSTVLNALNSGVQYLHDGGPVAGLSPGGSGTWVRGLYRMLMLDDDTTLWSSDLTDRLKAWFGTGSSPYPPSSWAAPWNARLAEWSTLSMPKTKDAFVNFMNVPGAGPINYQTLKWLKYQDRTSWNKVKASTKPSSVWLEAQYASESAKTKSAWYALQQKLSFGKDGTILDNSLGGFRGFMDKGNVESDAITHAIAHALGMSHDLFLARPWGPPLSDAEKEVAALRAANSQSMEFAKLLDMFSTWGLTDLVQHLLEQKDAGDVTTTTTAADGTETSTTVSGIQTALGLAKTYAANRSLAEAYNAALRDAADIASGASLQYAKFISLVSTASDPVGIRAVARELGLPDFGVVQMYEKLLSSGRITKGPRTARLDREVALFRSGLFYASTGGGVPGTGNRDSVPAMLTPGEFVLRRAAVRALGMDNVKALNNPQYFAAGGPVFPVTSATPAIPASAAMRLSSRTGLTVNGDITKTVTVSTTINNPVAEPSTRSLHRMLRRQAATGTFGDDMRTAPVSERTA